MLTDGTDLSGGCCGAAQPGEVNRHSVAACRERLRCAGGVIVVARDSAPQRATPARALDLGHTLDDPVGRGVCHRPTGLTHRFLTTA